jgi:hypothetical protein
LTASAVARARHAADEAFQSATAGSTVKNTASAATYDASRFDSTITV